jgi:hypothetical protein
VPLQFAYLLSIVRNAALGRFPTPQGTGVRVTWRGAWL